MKVISLLNESTETHYMGELIDAVAAAAPFFRQRAPGAFFYRGGRGADDVSKKQGFVHQQTIRKDRRPSDSSKALHDQLDAEMLENLGSRFRSQALFVTTSKKMAQQYGGVGIVLPVGNFNVAWSPVVRDAYHYFTTERFTRWVAGRTDNEVIQTALAGGEFGREIHNETRLDLELSELYETWVHEMYTAGRYQIGDLNDAMKTSNEIMITGEQYNLIRDPGLVRSYYIEAANDILGVTLDCESGCTMAELINAMARVI